MLTPSLITAVTLAQRRWGSTLGGLLVGLPLTSGPASLFFAEEHGAQFAARAAIAAIAGVAAASGFCLVYARAAARWQWPAAVTAAIAAYVPLAVLVGLSPKPLTTTYITVVALLVIARMAMRPTDGPEVPTVHWRWELAGRVVITTAAVVALTTGAGILGSNLSGVLSPLPLYAAVLVAFTHRGQGSGAAQRFLRAVVTGNVAFATFFLLLAVALPHHSVETAFMLATIGALLLQGVVALVSVRQGSSDERRARVSA